MLLYADSNPRHESESPHKRPKSQDHNSQSQKSRGKLASEQKLMDLAALYMEDDSHHGCRISKPLGLEERALCPSLLDQGAIGEVALQKGLQRLLKACSLWLLSYSAFCNACVSFACAGKAEHKAKTNEATSKSTPSVYEVQRDDFKKIVLTVEMMQDHLPGSYLDAINQL